MPDELWSRLSVLLCLESFVRWTVFPFLVPQENGCESSCKSVSKSCNYFLFTMLRFCCWLFPNCNIKIGKEPFCLNGDEQWKCYGSSEWVLYTEELFLFLDGISAFYMQVSSVNKLTFTMKTYILKIGLWKQKWGLK